MVYENAKDIREIENKEAAGRHESQKAWRSGELGQEQTEPELVC